MAESPGDRIGALAARGRDLAADWRESVRRTDLAAAGILLAWLAWVVWTATGVTEVRRSDPNAFLRDATTLAAAVRTGGVLDFLATSTNPPLRNVPFAVAFLVLDPGRVAKVRLMVAVAGTASLVVAPGLWYLAFRRAIDDRAALGALAGVSALLAAGAIPAHFPFGPWQYALALPTGVGAVVVAAHLGRWPSRRVGPGVGLLCGVTALMQFGIAAAVAVAVGAGWLAGRRFRALGWAVAGGLVGASPLLALSGYGGRATGTGLGILQSTGNLPGSVADAVWRLGLDPVAPAWALLAVLAVGLLRSLGLRVRSPLVRWGVVAFVPFVLVAAVGPLAWYLLFLIAAHVGMPLAVGALADQVRSLPVFQGESGG